MVPHPRSAGGRDSPADPQGRVKGGRRTHVGPVRPATARWRVPMLRDAGVRTKLLAVLAIPTVLLLVVTGVLVGSQVKAAGRAGQVHALTDVAIQVNRVVHSLQEERSATLRYLQDGGSGARSEMLGQRQYTQPAAAYPAGTRRRLAGRPDVPGGAGGRRPVDRRARGARVGAQVRRRRAVLRHRGRRLLHPRHPHRPRPAGRRRQLRHHRAGAAAAGLPGAVQRHRVLLPRTGPRRGRPASAAR